MNGNEEKLKKFPTMKSLDSDKSAAKAGDTAEVAANDNNGFFTPNEKINFSNVKGEPLFEEDVDFDTFSKSDFRAVKVKECVAPYHPFRNPRLLRARRTGRQDPDRNHKPAAT